MLIWKTQGRKLSLDKMATTHLQNAINFISNNHKPKDLIYTVRADVWVKNMSITIADRHLKQINTRLKEIKELNQSLRVEFDELNVMKENITQLKLQL